MEEIPEDRPTLVGAMGIYSERVDQALNQIKRIRPHIDRFVIIADESVTRDQRRKLRENGCEVYVHEWKDSTVRQRNQYLDKVQHGSFLCCSDPDEWYNEKLCKDLPNLVKKAEERGCNFLTVNKHDVTVQKDGSESTRESDFFKGLIFKKVEGTRYEGVGEDKGETETGWHGDLKIPGKKTWQLPRDFYYEHRKNYFEVEAISEEKTIGKEYDITEKVPINVKINLTDKRLIDILKGLNIWDDTISRRVDLAKYIESMVDDLDRFYEEFYRSRELKEKSIWRVLKRHLR